MGLWMLVAMAALAAVMVACFGEAAPVTGDAAPGDSGPEGAGAPEATPSPAATEPHDTLAEVDKFTAALGQHSELTNWSSAGKRWHDEAQEGKAHKVKAEAHDTLVEDLVTRGRGRYPDSSEADHRKYIEDEGIQAYAELVFGTAPEEKPAPAPEAAGPTEALEKRLEALESAATHQRQREGLVQDFIGALDAEDVKDPNVREAVFKAARGRQLLALESGERLTTRRAVKAVLEERTALTATAKVTADVKTGAEGAPAGPASLPSKEPPREEDEELLDAGAEERAMIERMRKKESLSP